MCLKLYCYNQTFSIQLALCPKTCITLKRRLLWGGRGAEVVRLTSDQKIAGLVPLLSLGNKLNPTLLLVVTGWH